jgi:hypothetical protein
MVSKDIFLSEFKRKLEAIKKAFQEGKLIKLKDLANDCIKQAVVKNEQVWAELSVISYSFYKILTKKHIKGNPKWPATKKRIVESLNEALDALDDYDLARFKASLSQVVKNIFSIDKKLGHFVQTIYDKAKVKMASSAYALGASLAKASELTGAPRDSVQRYIGFTTIHDELKEKKGIAQRLKRLKELMG